MSTTPKNIGVLDTMDNFNVTTGSAVTLSSVVTINRDANLYFVDIADSDVRVTFDGSTPSNTVDSEVGHVLKAGRDYLMYAGMFKSAKLLGIGGTAKIAVTQLNGYA